jgi:hypothetical protein
VPPSNLRLFGVITLSTCLSVHISVGGAAYYRDRNDPVGLGSTIRGGDSCRGQSSSDVVLVGESAEDLLPADPVLSDVDRFEPPGIGLGRGELAEGTVRPGGVVVLQVLGQHPSQVVLIDDQQPVQEFPAQGADDPSRRWRSLWAPAAGWPES